MDRRTFIKAASVTGAAAAAGVTSLAQAPAAQAGVLEVAKYQLQVPEIFKPLADAPSYTQALVIGSGFGGAITAYRLAQAGVTTTVLERGSRWPMDLKREIFSTDTLPDGRGFWRRTSFTGVTGIPVFPDYFGGVLDVTDFNGMSVWHGAAVGGGSVVYTGAHPIPEQRFFDAVFKGTPSYAEMVGTYYPRAKAVLQLSPMPDDVYNSNSFGHSRIWDAQSRKAGYSPTRIDGIWNWSTVRKEIAGTSRRSAIISESNYGNSNGAKFDLNQNYIKYAEATGKATVYPGHEVLSIGRDSGTGRYTIVVNKVDPTGKVLKTRTLTCDQLFLGAGSLGTTELLMRARATGALPNLNEFIGTGWGTNGDAAVVRSISLSGLTQGAPSASRIIDETGMPITLENWYVPGLPADIGMIGSLGMTLDPVRANFSYDTVAKKLVMNWPGQPDSVAALRAVNNKIAAANGVSTGFAPFAKDVNDSFTAHPLGGAVLGKATDNYGRVKGYSGLYVMDGAMIPGSTATVNPSLTIAAIAERNIENIIAAGG